METGNGLEVMKFVKIYLINNLLYGKIFFQNYVINDREYD